MPRPEESDHGLSDDAMEVTFGPPTLEAAPSGPTERILISQPKRFEEIKVGHLFAFDFTAEEDGEDAAGHLVFNPRLMRKVSDKTAAAHDSSQIVSVQPSQPVFPALVEDNDPE